MAPRVKEELIRVAEKTTDQSITKEEADERSSDEDSQQQREQQRQQQQQRKRLAEDNASQWPEITGNLFHRIVKSWTFCYMRPLLRKGRQQSKGGAHLVQDDLYQVPDTMKADHLVTEFSELYQQEEGQLLRVLWRLAAPTFVPAGFVQLVYMAARIALPLTMRELLNVLEDNPNESVIKEGLPYAIIIFLAAIVAAFAQHRQVHLATKSGIIMRAALISTIYEHSLKLSANGKAGLTTGEVTNLVATDTQKLFEVMLEGHLIWSCPLFIVIVTGLLWLVMGPELIVGVVVLIAFVPIVQSIVQRMLQIRKKRAILTDYRINIITSMLQACRVIKLNHYEPKVQERVFETRAKEMKLLRSELFMWGWTLVSAVSSPLLATAASFSCYVLVNEDNIITPSSAFTVLLLFSILRFPINMGARLVGKLAQALDSAHRISEFLKRETQSLDNLLLNSGSNNQSNNQPLVDLTDATFVAESQDDRSSSGSEEDGTQPNFLVRDVNLKVNESQICAVVGRVGSGKSILLQGLMGELTALPGSKVSLNGSIGYAAQVPFVLNATLRDNILFGSEYDKERYQKALSACCLEQDIQQFPGGDLCQIGERGVTLSGGQKQRVSLARVLYANPDIALLDDVFSALDSGTAVAVFEGLFGQENGALKSKGTVLVTHATKFLPQMDNIMMLSSGNTMFNGTWTELQQSEGNEAIKALDSSASLTTSEEDPKDDDGVNKKREMDDEDEKEQLIMTKEERESGLSSFKVWYIWFEYAGGWVFLLFQVLFLAFDRFMYVSSEWYVETIA